MTPELIGILGLLSMVTLLALRVPVGVCMILVATAGQAVLLTPNAALARLGLDVFGIAANATLSVIPLFVLMGLVLSKRGTRPGPVSLCGVVTSQRSRLARDGHDWC
jgi:TRAP-type mannitol/chloroaromatic compound transport system permease large subunit